MVCDEILKTCPFQSKTVSLSGGRLGLCHFTASIQINSSLIQFSTLGNSENLIGFGLVFSVLLRSSGSLSRGCAQPIRNKAKWYRQRRIIRDSRSISPRDAWRSKLEPVVEFWMKRYQEVPFTASAFHSSAG